MDSDLVLSEQLREMTSVLDEFDAKYTKKEQQLEAMNQKNWQLKEAYESIKALQDKTT